MPPSLSTSIVILDTNIVLDLFLFRDPRTEPLRQQLLQGQLQWQATSHMRNELERVLTYAHIIAKLAFYNKSAADILAQFDQHAHLAPAPSSKAPYTCKDADDQAFIDLAAHLAQQSTEPAPSLSVTSNLITPSLASLSPTRVILLSKDKAVLSLRKRLEKLAIFVSPML
jgi:predicted nucleic acid-binding protein